MEVIDIKSEEVICYINHSSDTSDSEIHHARFCEAWGGGLYKMTLDEQKGSK